MSESIHTPAGAAQTLRRASLVLLVGVLLAAVPLSAEAEQPENNKTSPAKKAAPDKKMPVTKPGHSDAKTPLVKPEEHRPVLKFTHGTRAAAYALGVQMGVASYQSQLGLPGYHLTQDALNLAKSYIPGTGKKSGLDPTALDGLIQELNDQLAGPQATINDVAPKIVALRGVFQGTLDSTPFALGKAYALGVCMGIAEAMATSPNGGAAGIVSDCLKNAKPFAASLGLTTTQLDAISMSLQSGAPLNGVYNQITNLRGDYQGMLNTQP